MSHITSTTRDKFAAAGRLAYANGVSLDKFSMSPVLEAVLSAMALAECKQAYYQGYYDAASEAVKAAV